MAKSDKDKHTHDSNRDNQLVHASNMMIESHLMLGTTVSALDSLKRVQLLGLNQTLDKAGEYLHRAVDELDPDLGDLNVAEALALVAQSEAFARTAHLAFQSLEVPECLQTMLGYVINNQESVIEFLESVEA